MVKRGRISDDEKNKPIDPVKKEHADYWIKYIDSIYEEYKIKFRTLCYKEKKEFNEDVYSNTILQCYQSICRNDLKDLTQQGMRNYFFNSFKMNIVRNNIYACEVNRDYNCNLNDAYEEYLNNHENLSNKVKNQMLNDFTVMYILNAIEQNFDMVSFFCFRIKHLIPNVSYNSLKNITKINDCKRRVVEINKWCKDKINKDEIYIEFIKHYPQFE